MSFEIYKINIYKGKKRIPRNTKITNFKNFQGFGMSYDI